MIGTEGTRLLREKRVQGRPHRRKAPRRLPDRPRKASAWSGNLIFTPTLKKLQTRRVLYSKTKLIGAGVREPCGKSVPKNTKIAQFSNHVNHQIVIFFSISRVFIICLNGAR
ncbi:hypothetical protein [Peribacillus frigoritolerans]|uniref:hypothetical protein n=1 Tax=Peribacillus frigoritolerans TaxID=450367 RepID=UPI0031D7BA36